MLSAEANNTLLDLHNFSDDTLQSHSIMLTISFTLRPFFFLSVYFRSFVLSFYFYFLIRPSLHPLSWHFHLLPLYYPPLLSYVVCFDLQTKHFKTGCITGTWESCALMTNDPIPGHFVKAPIQPNQLKGEETNAMFPKSMILPSA